MEKTKLTKRDYFKMLAEVVAESGKENQAELQLQLFY